MPGEVRLNLPPRVIESARAAQYANRARLDARAEDAKIQAKTVQQRQAAQRQAGLILPTSVTAQQQANQNRAVPDAPAPLEVPRIWRRWRAPDENISIGTGWMISAKRNLPYGGSGINGELALYTFCVGSSDTTSWKTIQFVEDARFYLDNGKNYYLYPDRIRDVHFYVLPAANGFVWSYVIFSRFFPSSIYAQGSVLVQSDAVTELQSMPNFIARHLSGYNIVLSRPYFTEYLNPSHIGLGYLRDIGPDGWTQMLSGYSVQQRQKSSSNVYEGLTQRMGSGVATPDKAIQDYQDFSGNSSIPVLGYDGLAGLFGTIKDLDVRSVPPPFIGTGEQAPQGLVLTDTTPLPAINTLLAPSEYLQELALGGMETNGNAIGEDFDIGDLLRNDRYYLMLSYDYHGGDYCADKLAELGITLP